MPGPAQRKLTAQERRELGAAADGITKARERWARLVRRLGYSAVPREMGLTTESVRKRVLKILGPS
jgi:hypothetical protein